MYCYLIRVSATIIRKVSFMDYEEYERLCEVRRNENEDHCRVFEDALTEVGLSEKTIDKHLRNVYFYLDVYLLREEPAPMVEGCYRVSGFLGDFFIRKCMWSSPTSIKSNVASFKKFYDCMRDKGRIEASDYEALIETINEEMEFWLEDCAVYNDPDADNPFSPF